jgi:hypothetical protein
MMNVCRPLGPLLFHSGCRLLFVPWLNAVNCIGLDSVCPLRERLEIRHNAIARYINLTAGQGRIGSNAGETAEHRQRPSAMRFGFVTGLVGFARHRVTVFQPSVWLIDMIRLRWIWYLS